MNCKFWKWKNLGEERVLELLGPISDGTWFGDEITPELFKNELYSSEGDITLWINSPGGDCVAASRIYSMLMDYKGDVTVKISGLAASAASVVAMAGNRVLMAPTAMLMIHNPSMVTMGNRAELEKAIDLLNEVKESIINAYEIKTGLSRNKLSKLMDDETWFNSTRAIELGFADGLIMKNDDEEENSLQFSSSAPLLALTNALKLEKVEQCQESRGRAVSGLIQKLNLIREV